MAVFKCQACGYEYDEKVEGQTWENLGGDWVCPVCGAEKSLFEKNGQNNGAEILGDEKNTNETLETYLMQWAKSADAFEARLSEIQQAAITGKSIVEPMRTAKSVVSWEDILIKGAQIAKLPLNAEVSINTQTIIGVNSKQPLVIDTPVYISHMSFGALSKEIKTALAKGSAAVKTAICSGEGGILPEEYTNAHKYILEYVPNKYSVTEENLKKVDAIEIKLGQSAKPGMGGHLPADKVTEEIAAIRGKEVGNDIHSPSTFNDIRSKEELKTKVDWLRDVSGGKPIGVKIAAGNIEDDLEVILQANPDFITIDGRGGGTGSAPKVIKDSTSVPTLFALYRAKKFISSKGRDDISIIITGGLRLSSDFAKAIAMGATAVAIATAAMIAGGCQQYRICNTGKCPVGIATQDPELRKRLKVELSAVRIENYLKVCTEELKTFARITGNNDIHGLSINDLCTSNTEISNHTTIKHI